MPRRIARTLPVAWALSLVCLFATQLPADEPAAPPAAAEHPDWAPWVRNSTQPPPIVERAKLPPTEPQPGDGPAEGVFRPAIAWFDEALKHVDELVPAAEAAADGIIAGGHVYCAGSPGFVQEMYSRAGGLAFLSEWRGERLGPNDVLLIGHFTPREETNRSISFPTLACGGGWNIPGRVIYISSVNFPVVGRTIPLIRKERWGGRLYVLDTRAPLGDSWSDASLGQMATTAITHAFAGEMFAAASRKGKTLATIGSDAEPFGPRWDKSVEGLNVNPKFAIPPVPAGRIAKDYLLSCQRQLGRFLESGESKQVRLAGERLAATLAKGNTVFVVCAGHIHLLGSAIPREFPRMTMYGRTWEWRNAVLKPGDALLYFGYLDYPAKPAKEAVDADASVVTVSASDGPADGSRTHVRSSWEPWDSVVNVRDYPVRILPSSGVVQTAEWYGLMAETLKAFNAQAK